MEYMRLEGFLGAAVSKLINKGIESKFGYKPDISLNSFDLRTGNRTTDNEEMVVLNTEIVMSKKDFEKLIEEATK